MIRADQDNHVHSVFSDGKGTIQENIAAAENKGLQQLVCVDHVRADTTWLPEFFQAVSDASAITQLTLLAGIETKMMDTSGGLDLPSGCARADRIMVADHQIPGPVGPQHPDDVKRALASGEISEEQVAEQLIRAAISCLVRAPQMVLVHFGSILPKVGMSEDALSDDQLRALAQAVVASNAAIEISERWRCPQLRTLSFFKEAGAQIILGSDAHTPQKIGVYDYCRDVINRLEQR